MNTNAVDEAWKELEQAASGVLPSVHGQLSSPSALLKESDDALDEENAESSSSTADPPSSIQNTHSSEYRGGNPRTLCVLYPPYVRVLCVNVVSSRFACTLCVYAMQK